MNYLFTIEEVDAVLDSAENAGVAPKEAIQAMREVLLEAIDEGE